MDKLIPYQYHLEIYERSYVNDPSFSVVCSTPTPVFVVGDVIDRRGFDRWSKPPAAGEAFRVAEVRHGLWEVGMHVGHKLMVRVEVVPLPK